MMRRELQALFIWNAEGAASGGLHSGIIPFFWYIFEWETQETILVGFFSFGEGGRGRGAGEGVMPLELVSKQDVDQHVKVSLLGNTHRQRRGAGWFCPHLLVWTIQADGHKQTNKQRERINNILVCGSWST